MADVPPSGPSRLPSRYSKQRSFRKRGKNRNVGLEKVLARNENRPLDIKFERIGNTFNVVGPNASFFSSKIGTLMGTKIPLGYPSWSECPEEDKARIIPELEECFNLEPHKIDPDHWELVQTSIDQLAAAIYRNRKNKKKDIYKKDKDKKPTDMDGVDWERCVNMWEDPENVALAKRNSQNRRMQDTVSLHGTASIAQHLYKKFNPDTGELPSVIDTYRDLHQRKDERGWVSDRARNNYDQMVSLREESYKSKATELDLDSTPKLTTSEEISITQRVLGTHGGCQLALGRTNKVLRKANNSTQPSRSRPSSTIGVSREEMVSFVSDTMRQYQESLKLWLEGIAQQNREHGIPPPPPPPPMPLVPPTRLPSPPHHDFDNEVEEA